MAGEREEVAFFSVQAICKFLRQGSFHLTDSAEASVPCHSFEPFLARNSCFTSRKWGPFGLGESLLGNRVTNTIVQMFGCAWWIWLQMSILWSPMIPWCNLRVLGHYLGVCGCKTIKDNKSSTVTKHSLVNGVVVMSSLLLQGGFDMPFDMSEVGSNLGPFCKVIMRNLWYSKYGFCKIDLFHFHRRYSGLQNARCWWVALGTFWCYHVDAYATLFSTGMGPDRNKVQSLLHVKS